MKQDNRFIRLKNNGYLQARNAADSAPGGAVIIKGGDTNDTSSTGTGGNISLVTVAPSGSGQRGFLTLNIFFAVLPKK